MNRLVFAVLLLATAALARGGVLVDNGPYITGLGNGAGGAHTSVIETGYGSYGFNTNLSFANAFMIADDFTVPAGEYWDLTQVIWPAYQTGSGQTSTFTGAYVGIFNGNPALGGTLLHGDESTNRLLSSTFSGVYRVSSSAQTDSTRPIMLNAIDLSFLPNALGPGTYWIAIGLTGSLPSGPWTIPVVPHRDADNAQQRNSGIWGPIDGSTTAEGVQVQDIPFILEGIVVPEPAGLALLALGVVVWRRRRS